jgi:Calcineurin-like phosphoesterase
MSWFDSVDWHQVWLSAYDSMGMVIGVLLGIVLGVLICLLFTLVFHPVITYTWRFLVGDHASAMKATGGDIDGPDFAANEKSFALVLSDLHVDTWEDEVLTSRTLALESLLTWGEDHVQRLILNGDLLDAPPHPNNQKDPKFLMVPFGWPGTKVEDAENRHSKVPLAPGALQTRFMPSLLRLQSFGKPTISTIGNHDIGVNGLRTVLPKARVANWAPGLLFESGEKSKYVFMEHGHSHDPILWVYVAYSLIDLLVRGDSSAAGQRGGRVGKAGGASNRTKDVNVKPGTFESVSVHKEKLSPGERLTRFAYRMAAYRRLRNLRFRYRREGIKIVAIMMGHTHIPDRFQLSKDTVYVNIGDWAGNKEHQTFALIKNEGEIVGPIAWR